jgi:hypothetical protein
MRARKVFWNFRYPGEGLYEAGPDEWLDVLVRVPKPGVPAGDPRFESGSVLPLDGALWFLECLDVLEPFEAPGMPPLLVLADPHAGPVGMGPPTDPAEASIRVRVMIEALAMLEHLQQAGMAVSVLVPEDFLVDPTGRWFFAGTDRVEPAGDPSALSKDLAAWASCVERWLGATGRGPAEESWPWIASTDEPARWLFDRVRRCLDPDPSRRPDRVADLWRGRAGERRGPGSIFEGPRARPSS